MYVLDAGLGMELEKAHEIKGTSLWAGHVLRESPQLVQKVYEKYLASGSTLLTTATYQTSYAALKAEGMDDAGVKMFWQSAVDVCKQSIGASGQKCGIIGSVGPWGSYVNDGSEYTGIYAEDVSVETLKEHHRPLVEFYEHQEDVDFIGFETVPNVKELEAILALDVKKPYFVSFHVNGGLDLAQVSAAVNKATEGSPESQLVAVGVNCVDYRDVTSFLSQFKVSVPLVVYPNLGAPGHMKADLEDWTARVKEWMQFDIFGIGGCCGTGPQEIAAVSGLI